MNIDEKQFSVPARSVKSKFLSIPLSLRVSLVLCALVVGLFRADAATWYVSTSGSDSADGTYWPTAKLTIQAAVNASVNGDTVLVTNGVYTLTGVSLGILKAITLMSVNGASATTIDAQQLGRCVTIDGYAATVNGFTLKNGKRTVGGGVYCNGGTILNCVLTNNQAVGTDLTDGAGGGAYLAYGTMSNCVFYGNSSVNTNAAGAAWAGAVYNYGGVLVSCVISNNQCTAEYGNGGGVVLVGGELRQSQILGNATVSLSYASGGGIYATFLQLSVPSLIESCVVLSNTVTTTDTYQFTAALASGGGLYVGNNTTVRSTLVKGNTARAYAGFTSGGGIRTSSSTVENCTIAFNDVASYYGHLGAGGGWDPIVLNDLGAGGGVIWGYNDLCFNNIIKFNSANNDPDNSDVNSLSYPTFINSDLGPWVGVNPPVITRINCLNVDPLFVNAAANDFQLRSDSPCRDAGTNRAWAASAKDLNGNNRLFGNNVDMGAYEYGGINSPHLALTLMASQLLLTWPVADAGFTLESTPDLLVPPVWSTVSPAPIAVDGHYTVTNPVAGPRKFYRLRQ